MAETRPPTILCLACYEKGADFLRECKRQGWRVLLLTTPSLEDAGWPREAIDDIFFIADMYLTIRVMPDDYGEFVSSER